MCLAIPGKVLSMEEGDPAFRTATVDFCGVLKTVNLAYTPEVELGDFVLAHVGFAVSRVDKDEAAQIYENLRDIGALEDDEFAHQDGPVDEGPGRP
jgi:hydrogenase expression/formation protein HypC